MHYFCTITNGNSDLRKTIYFINQISFRPSDLLKSKLRGEFRKREEMMRNLESSLDLEYSISNLDLNSDAGNTTIQ